jgi:hypothetical protein
MSSQKKRRLRGSGLPSISSPEPLCTTSVTVSARCSLGSRSAETLARAVRSAYAHSSSSRRLRCARAYVALDGVSVGILSFYEGCSVVATAPTEEQARKLLDDCRCASPEEGAVTNVFACGSVGRPLDLEAIRKGAAAAQFDGPRARSVLRLAMGGGVHVDAFHTGRYTVKGPSILAVETASVGFLNSLSA